MRTALVLGAGVIGVTSAWWLAQAGWRVRLLDRAGAVARGTSARNGGQLSYRYVAPFADAGVPLKALRWMAEPEGALRWRPAADASQWRWLAAFLARCNRRDNARTTARLAAFGEDSRRRLAELMASEPLVPFGWRVAGKLVLHRDPAALDRAARALAPSPERHVLSPEGCVAAEPAIAPLAHRIAGGLLDTSEAVADCAAFCESLHARLATHPNYDGLHAADARALLRDGPGRVQLRTADGALHGADAVVVAAGIASARLLRGAGVRVHVPLYPLKGYSLTVPVDPGQPAPRLSVTDFERKLLYARLDERSLRVAAMVDLVGEDPSLDPRRVATLMRIVRGDLPDAADWDRAEPWAGLRPATPDGAPRVGATRVPGLWVNVGHGGLGFTFACASAALLARRMDGERDDARVADAT